MTPFFLGLSVLVRQNNIIWLLMFFLVEFLESENCCFRFDWAKMKKHPGVLSMYGTIMLAFGVFVWWNGGIAIADKRHHFLSVNTENFFFFLFIFFILFWPVMLTNKIRILTFQTVIVVAPDVAGVVLVMEFQITCYVKNAILFFWYGVYSAL